MVYFRLYGNLGNLLFQHAAAISLGNGRAIGVTDSEKTLAQLKEYGEMFRGLKTVRSVPEDIRVIHQDKCLPVELPKPDGDLLLDGYFQSENYFDCDLVYAAVSLSPAREARLRGKFGEWLDRPGVTGISVRRGDYLEKASWHPFVGERYFRDCLAKLDGVDDFVVCSDGLDWCRDFFPRVFPSKRFLFIEGESVLDQLYVHTLCANNIVSNSSFSWWGAWIARERRRLAGLAGRVLAPSMWMGYAAVKAGATWDDLYFRGTEIVPNRYSPSLWLRAHWGEWTRRFRR